MSPTRILVTGASSGVGFEACRQLALKDGVTKIILGCRNAAKAEAAKKELEAATKRTNVFDILILDLCDLDSVRTAVMEGLQGESIDGLVLNAGGAGGSDPSALTKDGVTSIVANNVLGHVLLLELLLQQKILTVGTVVYAGSEAARGVQNMGMSAANNTNILDGTVEEFVSFCDGSVYKAKDQSFDERDDKFSVMFGPTKAMGALYMSSMAKTCEEIRFVTVSPGATAGTNQSPQSMLFNYVAMPMMKLLGSVHNVQTGAKRYVDVLFEEAQFKTGVFYASAKGMTGELDDQAKFNKMFQSDEFQNNCNAALHKFLRGGQ